MIGLIIIAFFIVYLIASVFVTKKTVSWAKTNNRKPWLWGGLAAFVMYNLVFWDWIPTVAVHKYYCATQAGFTVYKKPEQWKKDNSDVTFKDLQTNGKQVRWGSYASEPRWEFPYTPTKSDPSRSEYFINERIFSDSDFEGGVLEALPITKYTAYFADIKDEKILAKQVSYSRGYAGAMTTAGLSGFKTWLKRTGCNEEVGHYTLEYRKFVQEIIKLGEEND